jgi:hypothetical protein
MRIIRTIFRSLAMLLSIAFMMLWIRSFFAGDQVGWYINRWSGADGRFRAFGFDSDSGGIVIFLQNRRSLLDLDNAEHAAFKRRNPQLSRPTWIVHDCFGYPHMTDYQGASGMGFGYFDGAATRTICP